MRRCPDACVLTCACVHAFVLRRAVRVRVGLCRGCALGSQAVAFHSYLDSLPTAIR